MRPSMKRTRIEREQQSLEGPRSLAFECVPWIPPERVLDEPRALEEQPLRLELDEHVVDAALDGDAIRRAG
jgi:hypothetical protein